jgi:hypothetical protein
MAHYSKNEKQKYKMYYMTNYEAFQNLVLNQLLFLNLNALVLWGHN